MKVIISVLLLTISHLFSQTAFACDCPAPSGKVSEFIRGKTIIFGKAVKSEVTGNNSGLLDLKTTFLDVHDLLSGAEIKDGLEIFHSGNSSCATSFHLNRRQWVISHPITNDKLQHNVCIGRQYEYILPIVDYLKTGEDKDINSENCYSKYSREQKSEIEKCRTEYWQKLRDYQNSLPKILGYYVKD